MRSVLLVSAQLAGAAMLAAGMYALGGWPVLLLVAGAATLTAALLADRPASPAPPHPPPTTAAAAAPVGYLRRKALTDHLNRVRRSQR